MEQIFKTIKFIPILLILISCNSKKDENRDNQTNVNNNIDKNKILTYEFPDTVKINTVVKGKIEYDIKNINFDSKLISSRFLELLISTKINKELANYKEIDNNRLLTYTDSIPTGNFDFRAVFETEGRQMLNIVIRDYMFLKPDESTPDDKMVLRTSDCLFSKEVYVIK